MESMEGVWQILHTSQWQERNLEAVNQPCSNILSESGPKTDNYATRTRSGSILLNLKLQVRGLVAAFSHQPDDGSVASTGLILKSLDALATGSRVLIGRGKKNEAQISCSWRAWAGKWQIDIMSVKLAL